MSRSSQHPSGAACLEPESAARVAGILTSLSGRAITAFCQGERSVQMIFDLRQSLAREFLEVRVGPVLDLVLEERGVSFLIFDLPFDIVAVETDAAISFERSDHRIIGAVQQRVRRCGHVFTLQDSVERIDDGDVAYHHQMRIVANRGRRPVLFG